MLNRSGLPQAGVFWLLRQTQVPFSGSLAILGGSVQPGPGLLRQAQVPFSVSPMLRVGFSHSGSRLLRQA